MRTNTVAMAWLAFVAATSQCHAETANAKCDLKLDVTDSDPKGLNVRAAPSGSAPVVAVLKPGGDWIEVHVTAQSGDWYAIDAATMMDTTLPTGEKTLFRGRGFVHRSKVGASEMASQAVVRNAPDDNGKVVLNLAGASETPVAILGCVGDYYKIRVRKVIGWSKDICLNQLTTCV